MWPFIAATAVQLVFLLGFSRQSCAERNAGCVGSRVRGWTDGPEENFNCCRSQDVSLHASKGHNA